MVKYESMLKMTELVLKYPKLHLTVKKQADLGYSVYAKGWAISGAALKLNPALVAGQKLCLQHRSKNNQRMVFRMSIMILVVDDHNSFTLICGSLCQH